MKGYVVIILLLFAGTGAVSSFQTSLYKKSPPLARTQTLYVGGSGPGNYSHIQNAIDNASAGDTVYVYDDSSPYVERLIVNKQITLIGENKDTTVISSSNTGNGMNITADNVHVNGFTVRDCGNYNSYFAGILLSHSNYTLLTNITLSYNYNDILLNASHHNIINSVSALNTNYCGILLISSSNNSMSHNLISGNIRGVMLDRSQDNAINNTVIQGSTWGLYLDHSFHNFIGRCIFTGSNGAELYYSDSNAILNNLFTIPNNAVSLEYSNNNYIARNNISSSYGSTALGLWSSKDNNIFGNSIWNSYYGAYIYNSSTNTFVCNTFYQNYHYNLMMQQSIGNIIHHNNFYRYGLYDVSIDGVNTFDDGYPSGGNYWENYQGTDKYHGPDQNIPGSDGLADYPYPIPTTNLIDWYPLTHPYENYFVLELLIQNTTILEGQSFIISVHTLGGNSVQDAAVGFDGQGGLTDADGTITFTAPNVTKDTTYVITAVKSGYTSASIVIDVKNIPHESAVFLFGKITNLSSAGDLTSFNAVSLRVITNPPLSIHKYSANEQFFIAKDYQGFFGRRFIAAHCIVIT